MSSMQGPCAHLESLGSVWAHLIIFGPKCSVQGSQAQLVAYMLISGPIYSVWGPYAPLGANMLSSGPMRSPWPVSVCCYVPWPLHDFVTSPFPPSSHSPSLHCVLTWSPGLETIGAQKDILSPERWYLSPDIHFRNKGKD